MAVPVSRRTESKVKFFDNFYKMYDCLMYFVMKDFGIKRIVRNQQALLYTDSAKMEKEDYAQFTNLCSKYNINYEEEYPLWVLEQYRILLFNILNKCMQDITTANSIYPYTEYEYNLRRQYCSFVIADCEYILQIFQRVIHILPINPEKYSNVVLLIEEEISLLRKWKKSTNKLYKSVLIQKEKESNKENNIIPIKEIKEKSINNKPETVSV